MSNQQSALEMIGVDTTEQLREMVVDRLARELVGHVGGDDVGALFEEVSYKADQLVAAAIDAKVEHLGAEHVTPKVNALVENIILQKTNSWGEPQGEPQTFVEYLVARADHYMREEVDYRGRSREECKRNHDTFRKDDIRLIAQINSLLSTRIEKAMQTILADANKTLEGALKTAVELKLKEVVDQIQVNIDGKRCR